MEPYVCWQSNATKFIFFAYQDNNNPDVGRRELLELGMDAIIADHVAKVHEGLDDLV